MLKEQRIKISFLCILLVKGLLFCFSCANIVPPDGGPRDTDPPIVLRSTPPNFSTNFKDDRIRIYFDEYVELKNIRQKLIVSPPLESRPEFRLRGRSVIMEINKEELMPNTTYNFFFDDAIVDITEGNPIMNYRFVFSTGDYLDSLSVKGNVIDAYTREPEEGVYVMLYDEIYDSVPYLEKPVYVAKADKSGNFEINFIRKGKYKIFALKDENANYIYDLPEEKIAFLDSLIVPEFIGHPHLEKDTIIEILPDDELPEEDSLETIEEVDEFDEVDMLDLAAETRMLYDSIIMPFEKYNFYNLYLFKEEDTVQRITDVSLIRKNVMMMAFRVKTDSIVLREINKPFEEKWKISEMNETKDSLTLWILKDDRDSLFLEVSDKGNIIDTVEVSLEFRDRSQRGRRGEEDAVRRISFRNNLRAGRTLPYHENLKIITDNPVKSFSRECFRLIKSDTIDVDVEMELYGESMRRIRFKELLEQNMQYKLKIIDSCIVDIFGHSHDTLRLSFNTNSEEDYGRMIIDLTLPGQDMQYVLKLIDGSDNIIRKRVVEKSGKYEFLNLRPATYSYKLIEDANRDGRWTTGNYLKNRQPEKVYIFDEAIQLRANWIMESEWEIDINDIIKEEIEEEEEINEQ